MCKKSTVLYPPSEVAFVMDPNYPVLAHQRNMKTETGMQPHSHPRGQLLWAAQGVLKVTCPGSIWVVPSSHAVWIPSHVSHQVTSQTPTEMRNLYVDPSFAVRDHDPQVTMLQITPLMRELILRLNSDTLAIDLESRQRLGFVAIDEINQLKAFTVYLPMGDDPRLAKMISLLINDNNNEETLITLSQHVGASSRTIERLFKSQTGMTYRQWRSRYRLINALEHLRQGKSTTCIAYELGYSSVSSFIRSFKQLLNCTPQDYILHQS